MNELVIVLLGILLIAVTTLLFVFLMFRKIKKIKVSNAKSEEIAGYIKEGAMAFLNREYRLILPFAIGVSVLLALLGFVPGMQDVDGIGWQASICFLVGVVMSALAGYIGMRSAVASNFRTAHTAKEKGISGALKVAFSGGSMLGLSVAALGVIGLSALFVAFHFIFGLQTAINVVSGYSLGCSLVALFARVGGGIYTKAADVGADLVGKVEVGIPEDDPRNPAVIADNVGDNVGDIAGMGSDLCESYVGSIVSALALCLAYATQNGKVWEKILVPQAFYVFGIVGIGLISAILAVVFVRMREWKNPQKALSIATYVATGIEIIGALVLSLVYLKDIKPFFAVVAGLVAGVLLGIIAEYYTSADYKKVKEIAKESTTGHATNIISGLGVGMLSTALTIITLAVGIVIAYLCFGELGIALAAVGMLSTVGITVSVDAYGPIADNAGGIAQMSGEDPSVREITDKLDSVGNTTAAIGKGFCIGSATLTAIALFVAYKEAAGGINIDITQPQIIVGVLIGAMLPYLFGALTMKSVGRAANKMILEVREQFANDPQIIEGTSKPNYARCVDISTKAALKEMVLPAILAVVSPVAAGLLLGAEGLGGLLVGGLCSSIMLAIFMANSGGAWDNAKKYIEEGNFGGKGSEAHKSAVTGDTVGDPFKDTAGPAMNILIKLMSVISLILAPVFADITSLWEIIKTAIQG